MDATKVMDMIEVGYRDEIDMYKSHLLFKLAPMLMVRLPKCCCE